MKTLTKSLHTVTAVTNVARHFAPFHPNADAVGLMRLALSALDQHAGQFAADDPTVLACVKAIRKAVRL